MLRAHHDRQNMLRAWAAHDAEIFKAFVDTTTRLTGRPLHDLQILDVGCGATAPMTVLLHASGAAVTGVDKTLGFRWGLGIRPDRHLQYLREAGLLKAARKLAGELVYDRLYWRHLASVTGLRLSDEGLDLRAMDIQQPDLQPESFDVIHSNATWEHIADVAAANRMIGAALRPNGVAYIEIHLFPSLSGGHDLPWIVPGTTVLGDVIPWQHLRDPAWKAPVFLNRLRERDYRRHFEEEPSLTIEDWRLEFTEGHDLLTPEIQRELADYSPTS